MRGGKGDGLDRQDQARACKVSKEELDPQRKLEEEQPGDMKTRMNVPSPETRNLPKLPLMSVLPCEGDGELSHLLQRSGFVSAGVQGALPTCRPGSASLNFRISS